EGTARRADAEQLERAVVRLAGADRRPDERHQREARDAALVGNALPVARLVDERLADVEHDRRYSHAATRSRSAGVVTLSSPPSPPPTRPPSPARSAARPGAPARLSPARSSAARRPGATKACGVGTETSSLRSSVSATTTRDVRFTVSVTATAGTAPSNPSPSA